MPRTLETVLLGRDLLSPVLAKASANTVAYDAKVTASQSKTAEGARASAAVQATAAGTVSSAETRASQQVASASAAKTAARRSAATQAQALAAAEAASAGVSVSAEQRLQGAVTGTAATYRRSAAELREKLGMQVLDGAAAERSAAANSKAAASAAVFAQSVNRTQVELAEEVAALGGSTAAVRTNTVARDQATVAARAQQAAMNGLSSSNGLMGTSLTPLTAGLGALALGFGYAAFRGAEFDAAMSQVQAATMATGTELESLRELAVNLGADTQYSGEEAAQGITELAKAGVSTADILNGGLAGALDLAAAGQLGVAEAAEIAATQMVVFGLKGDQVSHVADLLAAGAGKAQGSVQDMGLALQYAGLPAAGLGLSIEETTGALGLFASSGLVGEKAGTAFRGMLVSMTNPAGRARETMNELNLEFFDAQGQFIGMEAVAGQLQERLGGLTVEQRNAALSTIFGNEALGAAQALYSGGAAGVGMWTDSVNDAGYAAEQAGILNDNLRGDLERLGGAFDGTMTTIGAGAQGALRFLVQSLTAIIDVGGDVAGFIADLPGPMQAAAVAVAALYLATGPLSGVLATAGSNMAGLAGRALGAVSSVGALTGTAVAARTALTGLLTTAAPFVAVAAIAYGVTELIAFSSAGDDARDTVKRLERAVEEADGNTAKFGAVTGGLDEVRSKIEELSPFVESWSEENRSWFERAFIPVTSGVEDARQSLDVYQDALADLEAEQERYGQNVEVLGRRYGLTTEEVNAFADAHGMNLSGSLQIVQGDFIRLAENAGLAASGVAGAGETALTGYENFTVYAEALGLSEDAAEELRKKTDELGESLAEFITPLEAYTGLIDAKKTAEQESAQATADATEDQSDSWEDYVGDVAVSIDEYLAQLEEQVAAQDAWQTNMLILAGRVSQGTIDELARMGPEGAPLVAQLVNASDAELARMETVFGQRAADATSEWGLTLTQAQPVLSAIAATAGQGVAESLAAQLAAGTTTIAQIAAQYGIVLADGVNPVLTSLGRQAIIPAAPRAVPGTGGRHAAGGPIYGEGTATSDSIPAWLSNGEFVIRASSVSKYGVNALTALNEGRAPAFATGGIVDLGRRFQAMGARVTEHPAFGGVAMGGHGRTSLHYTGHAIDVNTRAGTSALEQSELAPMAALARSLGFRTIFMAPDHYNHLHADDGGGPNMGSASAAPARPAVVLARPPSTAPFKPPVSTAANAAMATSYDAATAFLNSLGPATETLSGSSVPSGERATGIRALGQQIAAQMGYGNQFGAIDSIFTRESGWNPTAQNPTSTAYGIPQFLNATWKAYGGKTSDPSEQIRDGIRYMVDRYGSPNGAKAFWDKNHWYAQGGMVEGDLGSVSNPHVRDTGGPLLPGFTFNGTGRKEMVLPFADGGFVQAEDGSYVPTSFYGGKVAGTHQRAEDGSYVPNSFYDKVTTAVSDGAGQLAADLAEEARLAGEYEARLAEVRQQKATDLAAKQSEDWAKFGLTFEQVMANTTGWLQDNVLAFRAQIDAVSEGGAMPAALPYGFNTGDVDPYGKPLREDQYRDQYGNVRLKPYAVRNSEYAQEGANYYTGSGVDGTYRGVAAAQPGYGSAGGGIDYQQLGKAVADAMPDLTLNLDGRVIAQNTTQHQQRLAARG